MSVWENTALSLLLTLGLVMKCCILHMKKSLNLLTLRKKATKFKCNMLFTILSGVSLWLLISIKEFKTQYKNAQKNNLLVGGYDLTNLKNRFKLALRF